MQVVLERNLKYNRFKINNREVLNNDVDSPQKTLSQANTNGLYETENWLSTESALLPRQISWLDLYFSPTEFKFKKKKKRECESDRERSILDVLSERGSVLERVSYTCGVQTGFTLTSDFAVH